MSYTPIVREQDLPPAGPHNANAQEREHLDFKSFAERAKGLEHAKDIAAFANSLGGTILVGVTEAHGMIAIPGVAGQTAEDVKDIYEHAALRCSPKARIDAVIIARAAGTPVVAVNIPPFADAVLGVPGVVSQNQNQTEAPHSWRYPVRRATQTDFLSPEQLPMYMNPATRRAFVRLSAIPADDPVRVDSVHHTGGSPQGLLAVTRTPTPIYVRSVSLESNALELEKRTASGTAFCRVPLIDVVDVWEYEAGKWAIRLAGQLEAPTNNTTFTYRLGLL